MASLFPYNCKQNLFFIHPQPSDDITLGILQTYEFDAYGTVAIYDYTGIIHAVGEDKQLLQGRLREYVCRELVGAYAWEIQDVLLSILNVCYKLDAIIAGRGHRRLASLGMDELGRILIEVDFDVEI